MSGEAVRLPFFHVPSPIVTSPEGRDQETGFSRPEDDMRLTFATRRLSMRPFEAADARRIAYLAGDYDVAKMCGRVPVAG